MTSQSQPLRLPVLAESIGEVAHSYRCPDEEIPVSAAIHRARLAAGWAACRNCVWRDEGAANLPKAEKPAAARIPHRATVYRTEFGVRGQYLNAIDRFRGAQLAAIFSSHLTRMNAAAALAETRPDAETAANRDRVIAEPMVTIAVGYDSRHGAADVFAGVVSAVRQNGCHVIDAGHCTAASLRYICQRFHGLAGSLLVTGAGSPNGELGLDACDAEGHALSVPWQKFGVGVRLTSSRLPASDSVESSEARLNHSVSDFGAAAEAASWNVQKTLAQFRSDRLPLSALEPPTRNPAALNRLASKPPDSEVENSVPAAVAELQLPPLHGSGGRIFRSHRRSGNLTTVESERLYREWLLRWWPVRSQQPVQFVTTDERSAKRLEWLTVQCSLNIEIQLEKAFGGPRTFEANSTERKLRFHLEEDDRFLNVISRRNRMLTAEALAAWLNRCMPTGAGHLTAHATDDGRRVLLVDVAGPGSGSSQQIISDGLAVAGWILKSMQDGKNPLPA